MNVIEKIEAWGDHHHSKVADVFRMLLGLVILSKGIAFISNTEALEILINDSQFSFISFMLTHYVATAHLIGGVLIILGLLTRIAVLFQIPILLGAVLFVNKIGSLSAINSEFSLSVVVLIALIVIYVHGSGIWSLDDYMKKHKT
jgi:putative oxidoreductase